MEQHLIHRAVVLWQATQYHAQYRRWFICDSEHELCSLSVIQSSFRLHRSVWKHLRGLSMCGFLLLFPGFMAYKISQFFNMDFWLLILVSSCMLTSLQVCSVLWTHLFHFVFCEITACYAPFDRWQALCWSTACSWWRSGAVLPCPDWMRLFIMWMVCVGCWSLRWLCVLWRTGRGSHCGESGAGWERLSLSSTPTAMCGYVPRLAGKASCLDKKLLAKSMYFHGPVQSSFRTTMMSVPSASRSEQAQSAGVLHVIVRVESSFVLDLQHIQMC